MRKREVYEGWRFECEKGDMFTSVSPIGLESDILFDTDRDLLIDFCKRRYKRSCPCGKGCTPIRCRIIVENEVKKRRYK